MNLHQSTSVLDGDEAEVSKAKGLLEDIAKQYQEDQKASQSSDEEIPNLCFMFENVDVSYIQ